MKKYLLLFAVLVMAIGVYSFTTSHAKATAKSPAAFVQNWYDFIGDDLNDPLDYQLHGAGTPSCPGGSKRCAVKAVQDTGIPGNYPNLQDPSIDIRNKP